MRRAQLILLLGLFAVSACSEDTEYVELVERLQSPSRHERLVTEHALLQEGGAAAAMLQRIALEEDDPVAGRARRILSGIRSDSRLEYFNNVPFEVRDLEAQRKPLFVNEIYANGMEVIYKVEPLQSERFELQIKIFAADQQSRLETMEGTLEEIETRYPFLEGKIGPVLATF